MGQEKKVEVVGIIPARYASSRFKGKVLADLAGKPLVQHVWERAKHASLLDKIIIACDDERIKEAALAFGAEVVFTAKGHASGTDRITEVVNPLDCKIVVNIQADEPLIHPSMIDAVARVLQEDSNLCMATLIKRIDDKNELNDPNVVKVVIDKEGFALYFSRSLIPHRRSSAPNESVTYYKHIGLYSYTKDFLFTYTNLPESKLERVEKLEQLRVLENGFRIKTAETNLEIVGVDTPQDLERVKEILAKESTK